MFDYSVILMGETNRHTGKQCFPVQYVSVYERLGVDTNQPRVVFRGIFECSATA